MRVFVMAMAALCLGSAGVYADSGVPAGFEWPATQAGAVPDLRLSDVLRDARSEAREAQGRSREAQQAAGQARRRAALRGFVGLGMQPVTVDSGTVMRAVPYHWNDGPMLGEISYATGATMTGVFGPNLGVFISAPESPVAEFRGWVQSAASAHPYAMVGVFHYRNGERFSGCYCAGNNARGVYQAADGQRRFVGMVDFTGENPRPLQGIVEDRQGRLLAVVLGN